MIVKDLFKLNELTYVERYNILTGEREYFIFNSEDEANDWVRIDINPHSPYFYYLVEPNDELLPVIEHGDDFDLENKEYSSQKYNKLISLIEDVLNEDEYFKKDFNSVIETLDSCNNYATKAIFCNSLIEFIQEDNSERELKEFEDDLDKFAYQFYLYYCSTKAFLDYFKKEGK